MKRWRDWLVDGLIDGLWMYVNYVLQVKLYKWRWKSFRTSFMLSAITKLKFETGLVYLWTMVIRAGLIIGLKIT